MNKEELKRKLDEETIDDRNYSLTGGLPSDQLVLSQEPDGAWAVYYSERGSRHHLYRFETEDEACRHMLEVIRADPSYRKQVRHR